LKVKFREFDSEVPNGTSHFAGNTALGAERNGQLVTTGRANEYDEQAIR
jgi:hypothetical protein